MVLARVMVLACVTVLAFIMVLACVMRLACDHHHLSEGVWIQATTESESKIGRRKRGGNG